MSTLDAPIHLSLLPGPLACHLFFPPWDRWLPFVLVFAYMYWVLTSVITIPLSPSHPDNPGPEQNWQSFCSPGLCTQGMNFAHKEQSLTGLTQGRCFVCGRQQASPDLLHVHQMQ